MHLNEDLPNQIIDFFHLLFLVSCQLDFLLLGCLDLLLLGLVVVRNIQWLDVKVLLKPTAHLSKDRLVLVLGFAGLFHFN